MFWSWWILRVQHSLTAYYVLHNNTETRLTHWAAATAGNLWYRYYSPSKATYSAINIMTQFFKALCYENNKNMTDRDCWHKRAQKIVLQQEPNCLFTIIWRRIRFLLVWFIVSKLLMQCVWICTATRGHILLNIVKEEDECSQLSISLSS